MNIQVKVIKPVLQRDVDLLESYLGVSLRIEILDFYSRYNGGKLELNEVSGVVSGILSLNQFIPIAESVREIIKLNLRSGSVPIAWAEGGNCVVADMINGHLYFVDHEIEDNYIKISDNMDDFLIRIVPSFPMPPPEGGAVLFIDPDFLKRIKSGDFT